MDFEKAELTPMINTKRPQTKGLKNVSANDTQYFTGIDVVSNGSTTLSADVIDSDARIQISDIADFVGYLSYLDGVNYNITDTDPILKQGRFWTNWQNKKTIRPVDVSGNYVKPDWTKDWEIGIALLFKDTITYNNYTYGTGCAVSTSYWGSAPNILIAHTAYQSDSTKFFNARVASTSLTDGTLWSADTGFEEGIFLDTWYFVKMAYDSTTKTLSISATKDFKHWNTGSDTHSDRTPYTGTQDYISFCGSYWQTSAPSSGVILDLANCYIKQNGVMIWGHYDGAFAGENHYQNPAMPWRPLQDGYSNFWFELTDDTLSPWLNFSAKNNDAVINWGDGSGEQSLDTLTPTHTYSKAGRYIVKCKGVTGINKLINTTDSLPYPLIYAELSNEVTYLIGNAFYDCLQLKEIFIANADYSYGCFMYCSALEKVYHGKSQSVLLGQLFQYCYSLKMADIHGVTTLNDNIFYGCHSLEQITLPSTVTAMANNIFNNCPRLVKIHIEATTPPTLGTNVFNGLPSNYIIYVPVGYGDTYKAASGWSAYADHILEEGQTPNRAMLAKFNEETDDMR